jgi:hypothetical protein
MNPQITLTGRQAGYRSVDASTHDGLLAVLSYVRAHPRGWDSSAAISLIRFTSSMLAPIAKKLDADPDDAAGIAWGLWSSDTLEDVDNLWAYTTQVVKNELGRSAAAQRKLTSANGLRRKGASTVEITRIDEWTDTIPAVMTSEPVKLRSPALLSVRHFLIMGGFSRDAATQILDVLAENVSESVSLSAACDRLSRDTVLSTRLGLGHTQWRALVSLMLGTTRGQPGLFVLASRGHPDPLSLRHVRSAADRFLAYSDLEETA